MNRSNGLRLDGNLVAGLLGVVVSAGLPGRAAAFEAEKGNTLQFSEKQVAGGPDDFMVVRHLRLKGTNRQIGRKLAEIARERHKVQAASIDPILLRARRDFLKRNYASQFARSQGAAEAYGLTLETSGLDVTSLYINMNLQPQCSTVFYPAEFTETGRDLMSRNYDFSTGTMAEIFGVSSSVPMRPMTSDVYIIEVYPDEGQPSLYVTPYDLLGGAMDGVNTAGLTVALLADDFSSDKSEPARGGQAGLSEVEIPRFLLDSCSTVDEAKSALMGIKHYYGFVPCHYIIGDRSGKSFIWEYSAAHNQEYFTDGDGKPQIITNHPVYRFSKIEELPGSGPPGTSFNRMRRLNEEIAKNQGKISLEAIKSVNRCVAIPADPIPTGSNRPVGRTLWHAVYDCDNKSALIDFYLGDDAKAPHGQRRSGYLEFHLE